MASQKESLGDFEHFKKLFDDKVYEKTKDKTKKVLSKLKLKKDNKKTVKIVRTDGGNVTPAVVIMQKVTRPPPVVTKAVTPVVEIVNVQKILPLDKGGQSVYKIKKKRKKIMQLKKSESSLLTFRES